MYDFHVMIVTFSAFDRNSFLEETKYVSFFIPPNLVGMQRYVLQLDHLNASFFHIARFLDRQQTYFQDTILRTQWQARCQSEELMFIQQYI